MANEQLFHVGVKALIKNSQNRILLLQANVKNHSKNTEPYWDIPGGRIQENEDALTTLKREVFEETGIDTLSGAEFLASVISNHKIPLQSGLTVCLALMIYKVTVPSDAVINIDLDESTQYEWVSADIATDRLANKYPAEFTEKLKNS